MSYNLSIDTVRAALWKREVDAELQAVDELLRKVADVCQEIPGEDDTLMNTIYEVGTNLGETWTKLGTTFKEVQENCETIIRTVEDVGGRSIEAVDKYKGTIGFR